MSGVVATAFAGSGVGSGVGSGGCGGIILMSWRFSSL